METKENPWIPISMEDLLSLIVAKRKILIKSVGDKLYYKFIEKYENV